MTRNRKMLQREAGRWSNTDIMELQRVFAPWLNLACLGTTTRKRLFTWPRVFWLFLAQVLSDDGSCRAVLHKFLAWLAAQEGKQASSNTAAYCKARARLPMQKVEQVSNEVVRAIQDAYQAQGQWYGRQVKVVDGSGLSMPDTPENQHKFPQSKRTTAGCGFPEMRVVALFSLATGVLLHCRWASRYISERALFRQLWEKLIPGDVVLADRGFCGYMEYYQLLQRGVDSIMRLHQRRSVGVQVIKTLGRGDLLVHWIKNKPCPIGFSKEQWAAVPSVLQVRHITFTVDIPGFRSERITIATTLTDHKQFPASAFIELYRRRWYVELYFRDIKISMGMDVLRCLTPEMVEKEVMMHIIAYNLIRAIMIEAAQATQQHMERISFKGTCQALRAWAPILAKANDDDADTLYNTMLSAIGRAPLPHRPNRSEPRARKRRPKNYQLLNKPRRQFKEIPHRSKYVKAS
jgi:hypothetical protein